MCVREMLLTGILKVQLHEAENISDWRIIKCRLFPKSPHCGLNVDFADFFRNTARGVD